MSAIKVGYLPLYIKLYDDSDPHYRDRMVAHMRMMVGMLESQGMDIVLADVCRVRAEFEAAVRQFKEAGVAAVITQHLAYSPSLESIDALMSIDVPLIILDTTPDYDLLSMAAYKSGISDNHGIHGVQDMCNLLKQRGKAYELCVGHALHSPVISEVAALCRAAAVRQAFTQAVVGSVGGSFEGMGDFFVDEADYQEKLGPTVVHMRQEDVARHLQAVTDEQIDQEIALDSQRFTVEITNPETYRASVHSGLAIRSWAEEQNLTACTVNFLSLDKIGMPKMPFAECSKMMTRDLGYAREGDVLTAGMVGALRSIYPDTTFTEMFCPDWKNDLILLNHMGECNLNLAAWKPVLRTVPFNYNSCGETAAAYLCMRGGQAVFINLAPMGDRFTLIVAPVEMQNVGLEFGAYRGAIQGWLKPPLPVPGFLKAFSMAGGTHHSALVYNTDYKEIEAFGRMMGFDVVTIGA